MARYIHCPECKDKYEKSAKEHGEFYEYLEGTAKRDMFCDGCGNGLEPKPIKEGDTCFAACLFPTKDHWNYRIHTPSYWCHTYIAIKT